MPHTFIEATLKLLQTDKRGLSFGNQFGLKMGPTRAQTLRNSAGDVEFCLQHFSIEMDSALSQEGTFALQKVSLFGLLKSSFKRSRKKKESKEWKAL